MLMKTSLLKKAELSKITEAIGLEWAAAATYKYMSNVLKDMGYFGSATFFQNEGDEELKHYQLWADFVNDMGACADIPSLSAPEAP
ncbi:MAG TPA: ferritin-like domain-containing protein, partial [Methanosarcina sp.]|nr:ferritin-like domain-containing protein [Methanosarcina sp.]